MVVINIKDCAKKYKELEDTIIHLELLQGNSILEVRLQFDDSNFKHLAGLEKLEDVLNLTRFTSKQVLKSILNDTIRQDTLESSTKYKNQLNKDVEGSKVAYFLSDRIEQLGHLSEYLHNVCSINNKMNIHIYLWQKNVENTMRPNNSQINADYLIEFSDTVSKKTPEERTNLFVIKKDNGSTLNGVSIIPSDVSYVNDEEKKLNRCKIMSVKEYSKSTRSTTTLFEISQQERQEILDSIKNQDNIRMVNNDILSLKKIRKKYL